MFCIHVHCGIDLLQIISVIGNSIVFQIVRKVLEGETYTNIQLYCTFCNRPRGRGRKEREREREIERERERDDAHATHIVNSQNRTTVPEEGLLPSVEQQNYILNMLSLHHNQLFLD